MKFIKYLFVFIISVLFFSVCNQLMAQDEELDTLIEKAVKEQEKQQQIVDAVKSIIDLDKLELNMEGENPEYNERPIVKDSLKTAFTSQKLYESILEFIEKMGTIIMTRPNHSNAFNKINISLAEGWTNGSGAGILIVVLSLAIGFFFCMGITIRPLEIDEYIRARNGYYEPSVDEPVVKENTTSQRKVILVKTSFRKKKEDTYQTINQDHQPIEPEQLFVGQDQIFIGQDLLSGEQNQLFAEQVQQEQPVRSYGSYKKSTVSVSEKIETQKSVWPETKKQFEKFGQQAMMSLKNFVSDEQFKIIYEYNKDAKPFYNRRVMEMAIENADRSLEYYEDNANGQADLLNIVINSKVSNLYAGKKLDHHNASVAGLDVAMGLALGDKLSIPGVTQDTTLWSDNWR